MAPHAPPPSTPHPLEMKAPQTLLTWGLNLSAIISVIAFIGLGYLYVARLVPEVPEPSYGLRATILVLVSAAIGFVTNWLAIKMLFRPRRRHDWLVVWPQGLLPREQDRFAKALGHVARQRLLSPEAVVAGLADPALRNPLGRAIKDEVRNILQQETVRRALTDYMAGLLRQHGPSLVQRLRPSLRSAIEGAIEQHLTPERILSLVERAVVSFAENRELRRALAGFLANATAREGAIRRIMGTLQEQFARYREKYPLRGFLAEQFVIDWDEIHRSLINILRSREATEDLAEMMVELAGALIEQMRRPEASEAVTILRRGIADRLLNWFEHEGTQVMADYVVGLADNAETWRIVDALIDDLAERVPDALFETEGADDGEARLREEIRGPLRDLQQRLVEVLPVAQIVERQVLAMDPEKIEELVDEIGRRELALIQILGLVLGAITGGALILLI